MKIEYHDIIRIFRAGKGTGITPLEAKLIQKVPEMTKEVLYKVLLNIMKVYDALDCDRFLEILVTHRVGP